MLNHLSVLAGWLLLTLINMQFQMGTARLSPKTIGRSVQAETGWGRLSIPRPSLPNRTDAPSPQLVSVSVPLRAWYGCCSWTLPAGLWKHSKTVQRPTVPAAMPDKILQVLPAFGWGLPGEKGSFLLFALRIYNPIKQNFHSHRSEPFSNHWKLGFLSISTFP